MSEKQFKYRAFISYSHADEKWARWLHRSLESYRIPKRLVGQKTAFGDVPAKLAPVFRDREELASATDLGTVLTEALEGAASLVVICSRASAKSHWVNEEILAYKRLGRSDRIFSLIVDGEPYSSGIPGKEDEECFPKALRFRMGDDGELTSEPAEPIAADARPGKDGKGHARIKLIAGLLAVGFDDLRQRELQRRNRRMALITGSAVAGMVFAIGLATTAIIARNEAEAQRARAETEAETARRTASFMIDLFNVSDPGEARGRSITAREILSRGAGRIREELDDQPVIQASLMDTIGKVYTGLGLYDDASELLDETVELRRQLQTLPPAELAATLYSLANVLTEKAEYDRAASLYSEALSTLDTSEADSAELRIDINAALAELYFRTGEYANAEPLLRQVLNDRIAIFGRGDPRVANAIEEVGLNQFDQGALPEAEKLLREALALRWETLGREPHPDIAENLNNLALVLKTMGSLEEAQELYSQTLEMNRQLYEDVHPTIAMNMGNLAEIYRAEGRFDEAEASYREALDIQKQLLGEGHPEVARMLSNLAFVRHDQGSIEEAVALSEEALAIQGKQLGDRHPNVASVKATLGRWTNELGDAQRAEVLLREALDIQAETLEADHPDLAITRLDLAEALLSLDRAEEAEQQAQASEQSLINSLGAEHWITAVAQQTRGAALMQQGLFSAAELVLRKSYDQLAADRSARANYVSRGRDRLIAVYEQLGDNASAAALAAQREG